MTRHKNKSADKNGMFSSVTDAFLEHGSHLRAFLRRFIRRTQDVDDIAHDAYLKAFSVEQRAPVDHPKTLLFTIAKNIALNELRSKSRQMTEYIEECQADPETLSEAVEAEIEGLQHLEAYCEAVDALPDQCRRVYLMRKVHGLSHKEIARRLQITVRSVERHLQKGVIKCRAYIREQETVKPMAHVSARSERQHKERGR